MKYIFHLLILLIAYSCNSASNDYKESANIELPKAKAPPISIDWAKNLLITVDSLLLADDKRVDKAQKEFNRFMRLFTQNRTSAHDVYLAAQSAEDKCSLFGDVINHIAWPEGSDSVKNQIMPIVRKLEGSYSTQGLGFRSAMMYFDSNGSDETMLQNYGLNIDEANAARLVATGEWISLKMEYGISTKHK